MPVLRATFATLALLAVATPARAGWITNGSFESGDLTGWSSAGDVSVVTSAIGVNPRDGLYQAFLTTASDNGDLNNFSGSDAVGVGALESFLGYSAGTLGSGYEGSALKQTFTASAGDVLTFDYKFLTTEGANNDFAFVSLTGYSRLADTTAGGFAASAVMLDPVFGDPTRETPWRTYTYKFTSGGTYTLGIGVTDASDEFAPSALLLDNVRITSGEPTIATPEPASFTLAAIGSTILVLARRFRRQAPTSSL